MGSLAGQNIAEPLVYRRPRIGILSTGSELIELGHDLPLGKIHDTNRYSMTALVGGLGAEPVLYGSVPDNVEAIANAMECALSECDALITTGGVSVGDYDLTPQAMKQIGAEILVHGVDLKPGMACCYAMRDGKLLCGLSGNPASSITNFYVVALPALRRLCGRRDCETREFPVTLTERFGKPSPANRLLRGYSDFSSGTIKLRLSSGQGNVMISSLIACDLAAIVPAGSGPIEAGSILQGFFLDL
jgi:molybdopterin molybdotransferase